MQLPPSQLMAAGGHCPASQPVPIAVASGGALLASMAMLASIATALASGVSGGGGGSGDMSMTCRSATTPGLLHAVSSHSGTRKCVTKR